MAKIARKNQKLFGTTAGTNQMAAEFGSLAAAAPSRTTGALADPDDIQSLSEYDEGWFGAVLGLNAIAIEDLNALCFLFGYQLSYLMQTGVAEYDAATTYYIGSLLSYGNRILVCTVNGSIGQNPIDPSPDFTALDSNIVTVTTTHTALITEDYIRCSTNAGAFAVTLYSCDDVPKGTKVTIKNVGTTGNAVTITPDGSDLIDGAASITLPSGSNGNMPSVTMMKIASGRWDII